MEMTLEMHLKELRNQIAQQIEKQSTIHSTELPPYAMIFERHAMLRAAAIVRGEEWQ